jgi:hypothetical protein
MFFTFSDSARGNPGQNAVERAPGRHYPLLPSDPAALIPCDGA